MKAFDDVDDDENGEKSANWGNDEDG